MIAPLIVMRYCGDCNHSFSEHENKPVTELGAYCRGVIGADYPGHPHDCGSYEPDLLPHPCTCGLRRSELPKAWGDE
jgi:hypothetical protein